MAREDVNAEFINYFNKLHEANGDFNLKSLAWHSDDSQNLRFQALTEIGRLNGCSILDVGCGFGDLCGYLKQNHITVDYTGCDLMSKFVAAAGQRYPDGKFINSDIHRLDEKLKFDYVLSSGIFGLPNESWSEYFLDTVKSMFVRARTGVGFNLLSKFTNNPDGTSPYADPSKILQMVMTEISQKATLKHDYKANDFTVFLYK